MTEKLSYSGRTSAYEHKHGDTWKENKFTGAPAVTTVKLINAQWSNMPVEVEAEVKELWRYCELGNDHYYWEGSISDMDFLSYLQNSSVGFDQLNKELVVSNPAKGYSYIFSFESKLWYKISRSFKLLINAYPELLGVTDDNVVSLSKESESEAIEVLIISNCQSLDMPGIFKKLERTDFRSYLLTSGGKTSGFYVFASDDSIKYQLIQGCQRSGIVIDMVTQISPTSAKYYAFVINGSMLPSSEIKQIEILFKNKWNNRLR